MLDCKGLKKKLKNREKVFATTCAFVGWSGILEIFNNDILDFIIYDIEHGRFSVETAENMIRLGNAIGIPAVTRVADTEYHLVSKFLDIGSSGILIPRVETLEQALAAVSYLKFPPRGKKGCGGFSLLGKGETINDFNKNRIVFMQIESQKGIDSLRCIMENLHEEIDGIIIGPTDMSISMGIPLEYENRQLVNGMEKVLDICNEYDMSCGTYLNTEREIELWVGKGMNIIWSGIDIGYLKNSYEKLCEFIREIK